MSISTTPVELSRALRPQLPPGDDPAVASDIGTIAVAQVNKLIDDLTAFPSDHYDQAPRSAAYVSELRAALAHAVLDWLRRWPS